MVSSQTAHLPLSCSSFTDCLVIMFLYVVATKIATLFNDNFKGSKVYRQEAKKLVNFGSELFWGDMNSFATLKPILMLYEKASNPKIIFSKNPGIISDKLFWRSYIHKLIFFQPLEIKYPHNMNVNSFRVGRRNLVTRKRTLLKRFTKVSK